MSVQGQRKRTLSLDGQIQQLWAQVGWLGQTGAVYGMDDKPSLTERGGWAPLWMMIESEPVVVAEEVRG
jgi:hypothetical protein